MTSTSRPTTRIQTSPVGNRPKTPNTRFGTKTRSAPNAARYQPKITSERPTADMAPPVERRGDASTDWTPAAPNQRRSLSQVVTRQGILSVIPCEQTDPTDPDREFDRPT